MIEFEGLVYLDLQKTASSRLITLLGGILDEPGRRPGRHLPIDRRRPGKPVLCSIRNPWDWYVSIWAYGCRGEGALRAALLNHVPDALSLYADPASRDLFCRFVEVLWQASAGDAALSRAVLPIPDLFGLCGLLTARLASIAVPNAAEHFRGTRDAEDFAKRFDVGCEVTHFVRQEQWAADLAAFCEGTPGLRLRSGWRILVADAADVLVNASPRLPSSHYYSDTAHRRVATLERFVIERFGYR